MPWARLRSLLGARLGRFARRQDGNSTIEFVLLFPVFMALVLATIEAGLLMTRQVILERAVDLSLRDLRLGTMEDPSHDRLREAICARSVIIRDCESVLLLELRRISTTSFAGLNDPIACVNREEEIQPVTSFVTGGDNDLMMVRACVIVDPIVPGGVLAMALPRDSSGGLRLFAASVFVNEPS